jgi:hypothetical protein
MLSLCRSLGRVDKRVNTIDLRTASLLLSYEVVSRGLVVVERDGEREF